MEQIVDYVEVEYDKTFLDRWRQRDPAVVPQYALNWRGPGISNGYGFGEWFIECFLIKQGYEVIRNDYNLISKRSRFSQNNKIIANVLGEEAVGRFGELARAQFTLGIENVDLFVYRPGEQFFAEVKKGADKLRPPQENFMKLAADVFGCGSKVFYLKPQSVQPQDYYVTRQL